MPWISYEEYRRHESIGQFLRRPKTKEDYQWLIAIGFIFGWVAGVLSGWI